jgi:hypothetical protein
MRISKNTVSYVFLPLLLMVIEVILPDMDQTEDARFVTKGYNLETWLS